MEPPWTTESPDWQRLDRKLDPDHRARQISRLVDEELDLEPLRQSYSGRGSNPHRPELLIKMLLFEHDRGITQPAKWHRDLRENEPLQWLLMGSVPSLTSLYEFRDRVAGFLPAWNAQVIRQAIAEGYTEAEQASLDGSTVAANASRHHLLNLEQLDRRIEQLERADADVAAVPESVADEAPIPPATAPVQTDSSVHPELGDSSAQAAQPSAAQTTEAVPGWMPTTARGRAQQCDRYREARRRLLQQHQENQRRRKDKRKAPNKIRISPTDLEACLGRDKFDVYRPLYNVQVMTDLKTDLILVYAVSPSATDSGQLVPLIDLTQATTGRRLRDVLTDAGYPSGEELAACAARGVTIYSPWQENSFTAKKKAAKGAPPMLPKEQFRWDADQRQYVCPQGHVLSYAGRTSKQKNNGESVPLEVYQADPADCGTCPLRAQCVQSQSGARSVRRRPHEEHVEALKERMKTPEAKELYRQRSQSVERSYADQKEHRGLRKFSGRGLLR
ncbi:MAG TPA: IS1182 family transposase, partial [Candidatus Methylomirabilis sp.]|nr:IS1182 family transposase [Candidatus Methylomirabilis sp.]